jgi:LacI family transcriptional regulator
MDKIPDRPTIMDVAREAGVSHSTVSRALNQDSRISEATREVVLLKAKQLNYRPNILARALAKKGSSLIGLVLRHIEGSFFSEIIAGIQKVLEEDGYSIILCNSDMDFNNEKNHLNILKDKQVDGILITPITTEGINRKVYNDIIGSGIRLIMITNPKEGVRAPYVKVDNMLGGYMAGKHLIELGHRRICFISPNKKELLTHKRSLHSENIERYNGLYQALREYSLLGNESIIEAFDENVTEATVEELLRFSPKPTAIFAYSDMMAIKIMRLLESRGHRVPDEFSIIGYDDLDIASWVSPSLTTIAQPKVELGRISALKILGLLEGKSTTETVIKPELIIRKSTSSVRSSKSKS